jgi:hypothetical protein
MGPSEMALLCQLGVWCVDIGCLSTGLSNDVTPPLNREFSLAFLVSGNCAMVRATK